MSAAPALEGWAPIRFHQRDEALVEWCWLDGLGFDEPFFVQTIERAFRTPFSLLLRRETPVAALDAVEPGLTPSGFILHGSRCGSTLVARMLAAAPQHLVISEPPPVDQVLRARAPDAERLRWLRGIVSALGRPRRAGQRAYILKLDAWSTCSLGLLKRAFPEVPWVFLFREPVQVLASHFRQRGAHMVPGALDPRIFELDPEAIGRMSPEEYTARVLASIYRSALEQRGDRSLFVDYRELPDVVFERILDAFGLDCASADLAAMRELTAQDAKNPGLVFSPGSDENEREASPALHDAADRWVRPLYEELLAC